MLKALLIATFLLFHVPHAHAIPIIPTRGQVSLTAPACGWSALLRGSPEQPAHYAPACGGLTVQALLNPGDPVMLETSLRVSPDPFTTLQAANEDTILLSRDRRAAGPGIHEVALGAPSGVSHLWLSVMAFYLEPLFEGQSLGTLADGTPVSVTTWETAQGLGFYFDLDYPFTDEPLAHAPEPGTLFLVGSALALIGWRIRRSR